MSNLGMTTVSLCVYIYKQKYKSAKTDVLHFKQP